MVTKTKVKTAWDKLSKKEQEKLTDEYMFRVIDGKPTKRIALKIAKLKGIKLRSLSKKKKRSKKR